MTATATAARDAAVPAVGTLSLGGRRFRPAQGAEVTFRQHQYAMREIRTAGLLDAVADETEFIVRVLNSGRAAYLLAGMLLELPPDPADGDAAREWTPGDADAWAAFFDGLTGAEHHATLDGALVPILALFFPLAVRSSRTSPSSSAPPLTADP